VALSDDVFRELTRLGDKHTAARMLDCGAGTLKNWRLDPTSGLIEGVHWIRPNQRVVRYRLGLLKHWFEHRHEPDFHRRLVEEFRARQSADAGISRGDTETD
jgi:hypothetical protein